MSCSQTASNNRGLVQGNLIGTNKDGTGAVSNTEYGVYLAQRPRQHHWWHRGGGAECDFGRRHLRGVREGRRAGPSNQVQGNYIGTNAAGTGDLGNGHDDGGYGVYVDNVGSNTIGGTASGSGNVISGNVGAGILLDGAERPGPGAGQLDRREQGWTGGR